MKPRFKNIFQFKIIKESGRNPDSFTPKDLLFFERILSEGVKEGKVFAATIRKFIDNNVVDFEGTYNRYLSLENFTYKKEDILYVYGEEIGGILIKRFADKNNETKFGSSSHYDIMISQAKCFKNISINSYQKEQLIISLELINTITTNRSDWYFLLATFVENNVKNYIPRIKFIIKHRTSVTLKAHIVRYGKIEGLKRYYALVNKKSIYAKNNPTGCILLNPEENIKLRNNNSYGNVCSYKYWAKFNYEPHVAINLIKYILSIRYLDINDIDTAEIINSLTLIVPNPDDVYDILVKNLSSNICSKMSLQLFEDISKDIPNLIYGKYEQKIGNYKIDLYDPCSKIAVEFYGDFWHRNPKLYDKDFISMGIKSSEIWSKNEKRIEEIKEHVNDVIIIWELDYINEPTKIKDEIVKYLNEKRKEIECM